MKEKQENIAPILFIGFFASLLFIGLLTALTTSEKEKECLEYGEIKSIEHFESYGEIDSMVEFEDGTYVQRAASEEENCKEYGYRKATKREGKNE